MMAMVPMHADGQHLATWTEEDVAAWSISSSLPARSSHVLAGFDGTRLLSPVTLESLIEINNLQDCNRQLELTEVEIVFDALSRLRHHYIHMDTLAALNLQAEETPDLEPAIATFRDELGNIVFDQSYSALMHEWELEKQRRVSADAEHASRLAWEAKFDEINVRLAQVEEQKRLDHELACRVQRVQNFDDASEVGKIIEEHGRNVIRFEPETTLDDGAETSSNKDSSGSFALLQCREATAGELCAQTDECAVCMENIKTAEGTLVLECEHKYCIPCLRELFCTALKDSSMLPAVCCQKTIPQEIMQKVLSKDEENILISRLREKLAKNKMYCPRTACSMFIDLDHLTLNGLCVPAVNGIFECMDCGLPLCLHCKSSAVGHQGPNSCQKGKQIAGVQAAGEEELISLAAAEGWKRCPGCSTFVSLRAGCNHITCACGFEFCFECGIPWERPKLCTCVLYTEEMLLRENDRRVHCQEERLGRELAPAERAHIWQDLDVQNQRAEECSHRSKDTLFLRQFSRSRRRRPCDNCECPIPLFCYECSNCDMRFCHTCRFNRRLP